jgi:hypothetical protein
MRGTGAIFHVSFPFVSLLCSDLKDKYSYYIVEVVFKRKNASVTPITYIL